MINNMLFSRLTEQICYRPYLYMRMHITVKNSYSLFTCFIFNCSLKTRNMKIHLNLLW